MAYNRREDRLLRALLKRFGRALALEAKPYTGLALKHRSPRQAVRGLAAAARAHGLA